MNNEPSAARPEPSAPAGHDRLADGDAAEPKPSRARMIVPPALLVLAMGGAVIGLVTLRRAGLLPCCGPPPVDTAGAGAGAGPTATSQPDLPLRFTQTAAWPTGFAELRGLAVDSADRLIVVGDSAVKVFTEDGQQVREWAVSGPARCVAVGRSGTVYVGLTAKVETFDSAGRPLSTWTLERTEARQEGRKPFQYITSIAAAEPDVFVADARNLAVFRFAANGDFIQAIGTRDTAAGVPGLVVPSPHLDCAVDSAGALHVVNPGRWRIERYTFDGRLLDFWGEAGWQVEAFPGCCNPTDIALFPDGRVAASEKGIPRVKVYGAGGHLLAVTGAGLFHERASGLDLAIDSRGRIIVADPADKLVRVFTQE